MFRVKIHGAGSIGNHMAHAARSKGWRVDVVDTDPAALERTRKEIYPARYGAWDEDIRLFEAADAPTGDYDLIVVGTPPQVHIDLALAAIDERPQAVLVEKPVCGPDLAGAQELVDRAAEAGVRVFVGYDHVVGDATRKAVELAGHAGLGRPVTLDVEFREHWGGIFGAHPWLEGPWDTYLGFSARGGGASGEHSHALNLWQHFATAVGAGRIAALSAAMDVVEDGRVAYDRLCLMTLRTEGGLVGRCVQDVVTQPPRKWARIQFENGFVEWRCGIAGKDIVSAALPDSGPVTHEYAKSRPDDFIRELDHIVDALNTGAHSPIAIERGLDTMLAVAAAHRSHETGSWAAIDYAGGYRPESVKEAT